VPSFTLYSERRSEFKQYVRTTPIGLLASVTREQWERAPLTFGYQIERGRTQAAPAFFCALFQICDEQLRTRIADSTLRLAVASAALTIDRTDTPLSPSSGGVLRLEFRHASHFVGSSPSLQFNKGILDASWFAPLGGNSVLALRLRVGAITPLNPTLRSFELSNNFVPPQERLYGGGTNTVRGVQQNELGPLVYIADRRFVRVVNLDANTRTFRADSLNHVPIASKGYNFVPTGGNRLLVANAEVRLRDPFFPNLLQWTVFTDAGNVWERENTGLIKKQSLRITPGLGLSVLTFLGPIGVTAGYNDKQRPAGQLYYNDLYPADAGEAQPNVSNLTVCLPTTGVATVRRVGGVWQQDRSECSASGFRPEKQTAFRDRIVLLFSIGQAF
jgi:outer membrane protein insertion porin family/translocation and assembly module TamA